MRLSHGCACGQTSASGSVCDHHQDVDGADVTDNVIHVTSDHVTSDIDFANPTFHALSKLGYLGIQSLRL